METLLDTLVRLASLGASGVCIFAIFWIGWIIYRLPRDAGPERYRSLRMFMLTTLGIAVISGITGVMNAAWNQGEIAALEEKLASQQGETGKLQTMRDTMAGMLVSLEVVLTEKAVVAAASDSDVLQSHVTILNDSLSNLRNVLDSDAP